MKGTRNFMLFELGRMLSKSNFAIWNIFYQTSIVEVCTALLCCFSLLLMVVEKPTLIYYIFNESALSNAVLCIGLP